MSIVFYSFSYTSILFVSSVTIYILLTQYNFNTFDISLTVDPVVNISSINITFLFLIKLILFFILILLNIFLGFLNYKNTSLGISKKLLVASSGGIEKVTTLIKQEYLQSVEIRENPFQRKKSVCDYKLDIYSNKTGDIVFIKNMKKILLNTIEENLIL